MRSSSQLFESEMYFGVNGSHDPSDEQLGCWQRLKTAAPHYGLFFLNEQSGHWKYVVDESASAVQLLSGDDWIYDQLCLDESVSEDFTGRHRLTVILDQTTPHCMWLGKLPQGTGADFPLDTVFCSGDFSVLMQTASLDGYWTIVECPMGGHFYLNQRGQWHFDYSWQNKPPTGSLVAQVAYSDELGRTHLGSVRFHWVDCGPTTGLKPVVSMESVGCGFRGNLFGSQPSENGNLLTHVGGEELFFTEGGWSQWLNVDGGIAMFRENGAFIAIGDTMHVCLQYTDIDGCDQENTVVVTEDSDVAFQHWYDDEDTTDWQAITDSADIAFADDAMSEPFSDSVFDSDSDLDLDFDSSANDDRRFNFE